VAEIPGKNCQIIVSKIDLHKQKRLHSGKAGIVFIVRALFELPILFYGIGNIFHSEETPDFVGWRVKILLSQRAWSSQRKNRR